MNKFRFQLLLFITLVLAGTVAAKCPTGSVEVHGRVDSLPPGPTSWEVSVLLETPKNNESKSASISGGEFTVSISFSTLSSSFLGGDRCHNLPTAVAIKVEAGGKTYVQKRIQFKDNFEMYAPFLYRLKRELSIDVLK